MLDCSFEPKCSRCYNQSMCSEGACYGYVPYAVVDDDTVPYIVVCNTQCRTDCPYLEACYQAEERYEEEKFMQE